MARGVARAGQVEHNSTGAELLREAPKRPNNITSTVNVLPNELRFDHGVPDLLFAPGAI